MQSDYFYVAQSSGDFNVVATDLNDCEVEAAIYDVIAEIVNAPDNRLEIFPNPTQNNFTVKYNSTMKSFVLQIENPVGEIVYTENLSGKNRVFNSYKSCKRNLLY